MQDVIPAVEVTPSLEAHPTGWRYAGFWWRFLAIFVDNFFLSLVLFVIMILFTLSGIKLFSQDPPAEPSKEIGPVILMWAIFSVLHWLYFSIYESSAWQATPGKKICGLIVTDRKGMRISFLRATGRYFAAFVSRAIFYVGYIMAGVTTQKQALHDMIADTLVWKRNVPIEVIAPQVLQQLPKAEV